MAVVPLLPRDRPATRLLPDRRAAARLGVSPAEIRDAATLAGDAGKVVAAVRTGHRVTDVILRIGHGLQQATVPLPGGGRALLTQLARIELVSEPAVIRHLDGRRDLPVAVHLREGAEPAAIRAALDRRLSLSPGVRAVWTLR